MASVRVEGFPSPDAKTKMEAMVDDESEKSVDVSLGCLQVYLRTQRKLSPIVNLSEDERQDRKFALVDNQRKKLMIKDKMTSHNIATQDMVGKFQLAVEEEPEEVLRVKDRPSLAGMSETAIEVFGRQAREYLSLIHI